jgi:predicted O-linked N-acetylglucosamine transferase (SPINDLY family)
VSCIPREYRTRVASSATMPASLYTVTSNDEKFAIVCQKAYSLRRVDENDGTPWPRLLLLFIIGNFDLDEANAFSLEAFDKPVIPQTTAYFANDVEVSANAFTMPVVPLRLLHIVDTYSTVDFVDKYTFFLMKLVTNHFFESLADAESKARRRNRKTRRERKRLGLLSPAGRSSRVGFMSLMT